VRVSDAELEEIDRLAIELHLGSRADVLRCALARLRRDLREDAIGEAYRLGYSAKSFPAGAVEQAWAGLADTLIADGDGDVARAGSGGREGSLA
jgi:hypothetical protein